MRARIRDAEIWWSEIDRWSFVAVAVLFSAGIALGFSTSPDLAENNRVEATFYVQRQLMFAIPAVIALFYCASLEVRHVRRVGVALFILALIALLLLPVIGETRNGATRWLSRCCRAAVLRPKTSRVRIQVGAWANDCYCAFRMSCTVATGCRRSTGQSACATV